MRRPLPTRPDAPTLHALLGPTNTGKTHTAIERMLQHHTGRIGLPLRLLAREVYDRVTAKVGEDAVALITGEERRVGRAARYQICTVEAMPESTGEASFTPEFLAVDEVQLAGDPGRGHVFTDRILHARGSVETLLLGSDTVAPLLRRLFPGIDIESRPRLSALTYAGPRKLGGLPRRSAIIGFSAERVYALAELARRKHGGAAVVMGALSPRTRNAQVALFQSGEVPVLVATDAIGMGLNMDILHVAFSERHKFDGVRTRLLLPAELGQIAGRAGRATTDGTFGTTEDCPELAPNVAEAVERQDFPPLRRLWWRNNRLDYTSVDTLLRSLRIRPAIPGLEPAEEDEDEAALIALSRDPEVRRRAGTPDDVRLLWEVCRIPDYRKLPGTTHPDLLSRLYIRLCDHGALSATWIERQLIGLDRVDGDLDTLTTRLAAIRTWTYVGHRPEWIDQPDPQHARSVEDRVSDALHNELTARFVDRRALTLAAGGPGRLDGDVIRIGGVVVGELRGLAWRGVDGEAPPSRAREVLAAEVEARVVALTEAPTHAFTVDDTLRICWNGEPVARLTAGPDLREPGMRLLRNELLSPSARTRIERRLVAWTRDYVNEVLAPLRDPTVPRGPARGLLYALEAGLGNATTETVQELRERLGGPERAALARVGVRFGVESTYALPMLERVRERAVLVGAATGWERLPPLPSGPVAEVPAHPVEWPLLGYVRRGPSLVRIDAAEAIGAVLRAAGRAGAFDPPAELTSVVPTDRVAPVLEAWGYTRAGERWVRGRSRR